MNGRHSLLYWSFPCGTWFGTQVRVSFLLPLLIVTFLFWFGPLVGLVFGAIFFASVLLHEYGHVLAARATGGSGNEILLWPLGGLAFVHPGPTVRARVFTAAAGPLCNLAVCLITIWPALSTGQQAAVLNPFVFPAVSLSDDVARDLLVLVFTANWIQFLGNLIPVYPLDGGRILQTLLSARFGKAGTDTYVKVGFVVAFVGMFVGLVANLVWLVFVGAVVLVLNVQESIQVQTSEDYDESFMGYDFSQGYTSLEKSEKSSEPPRESVLQRWRRRRKAEKERRRLEQEAAEQQQVDDLLDKVRTSGIDSLTDAERRILDRASARYRERGRSNG